MESRKKMMVKPQAGPLVLTVNSLTSRELLVRFFLFVCLFVLTATTQVWHLLCFISSVHVKFVK